FVLGLIPSTVPHCRRRLFKVVGGPCTRWLVARPFGTVPETNRGRPWRYLRGAAGYLVAVWRYEDLLGRWLLRSDFGLVKGHLEPVLGLQGQAPIDWGGLGGIPFAEKEEMLGLGQETNAGNAVYLLSRQAPL